MAGDLVSSPPEAKSEGRYANYFNIGHNAFEVVLEFGQCYELSEPPQLHSKIVTGPAYAKVLLELLQRSLEEYEKEFGVVASGELNQVVSRADVTPPKDNPPPRTVEAFPMSQMQRPISRWVPGGLEPPDPSERLKQLQNELTDQQLRYTHLGQQNDQLKADITELSKIVDDMKTAVSEYGAKVKDLEQHLHTLRYFYEQKHKMIEGAIGERKGRIDELICAFDYKIETMQGQLTDVGQQLVTATAELQRANDSQTAKETEYNTAKSYLQTLTNKLSDLDSLRGQITQADDATDVASMYFLVLEFEHELHHTHIISQHELALELRHKLGDLEAAKEQARAKAAVVNSLQAEQSSQQQKLQDQRTGRRQQLLTEIQALFPVPAPPAASGTPSGGTASGTTTGSGSATGASTSGASTTATPSGPAPAVSGTASASVEKK
jgi:hypothetical protein